MSFARHPLVYTKCVALILNKLLIRHGGVSVQRLCANCLTASSLACQTNGRYGHKRTLTDIQKRIYIHTQIFYIEHPFSAVCVEEEPQIHIHTHTYICTNALYFCLRVCRSVCCPHGCLSACSAASALR